MLRLLKIHGMYCEASSLVAHYYGGVGRVGSKPATPTNFFQILFIKTDASVISVYLGCLF